MKCQKCGMNEANVSYTEIINGKKAHVVLCDKCANEMNIGMNFNFDFNDVFGAFFNEPSFAKSLGHANALECGNCETTYDEFANTGMFGCEECYDVFSDKLDNILPRLQGSNRHIGRRLNGINQNVKQKDKKEKTELEKLQEELKKCVEKEEYEKAAVIRDKIKKLESDKK